VGTMRSVGLLCTILTVHPHGRGDNTR